MILVILRDLSFPSNSSPEGDIPFYFGVVGLIPEFDGRFKFFPVPTNPERALPLACC